MAYDTKDIRNIMLMGHQGAGKTTLGEAVLFSAGAIPKQGSVLDGTTISDYNEDERERKISINSSVLSFLYNNSRINIIDTPGFSDFIGEQIGAMRAVDGVILVINASSGVEIGAEKAWKILDERHIPSIIFINRLDKENTDFSKCVDVINKKFGTKCAVVTSPIGKESSLKGVCNLVTGEGLGALSGEDKDNADLFKSLLSDAVAESDDVLLEKYLDKGELAQDEIKNAFRKALITKAVIPVFAGSSAKNIGIKDLLNAIVDYMPSPLDVPVREGTNISTNEKIKIEPNKNGILSGQVFKTISDPYVGQVSVMRVYSGTLQSNGSFYNVDKRVKEKIGPLFTLMGKNQSNITAAIAGDIIATSKLKDTQTNNSISDEKNPIKLSDIRFPEPAISYSIKPKTRADEDKISAVLHKIIAEDPTFKAERDVQTKELVVSGLGDLHINIMLNRMKSRYGVNVDVGTPKVAYKETILGNGDSQYRHKKQSGGAGQFAEVWLRVGPLERGKGFDFVDEVVGGAIPRPFIVSCEKGVRSALGSGFLAGFPVVDVKATVYDGKTHPVDSKDIAFQIAAKHAFKEAALKAKPVLLEPIMDIEISVPDEAMGDIAGSINSRRGRIMGMEPAGEGTQIIKAKMPLEEIYKYVNELKSLTAGRASYTMKFSNYEIVPSNLAQVIIDKAKQTKVEEQEE